MNDKTDHDYDTLPEYSYSGLGVVRSADFRVFIDGRDEIVPVARLRAPPGGNLLMTVLTPQPVPNGLVGLFPVDTLKMIAPVPRNGIVVLGCSRGVLRQIADEKPADSAIFLTGTLTALGEGSRAAKAEHGKPFSICLWPCVEALPSPSVVSHVELQIDLDVTSLDNGILKLGRLDEIWPALKGKYDGDTIRSIIQVQANLMPANGAGGWMLDVEIANAVPGDGALTVNYRDGVMETVASTIAQPGMEVQREFEITVGAEHLRAAIAQLYRASQGSPVEARLSLSVLYRLERGDETGRVYRTETVHAETYDVEVLGKLEEYLVVEVGNEVVRARRLRGDVSGVRRVELKSRNVICRLDDEGLSILGVPPTLSIALGYDGFETGLIANITPYLEIGGKRRTDSDSWTRRKLDGQFRADLHLEDMIRDGLNNKDIHRNPVSAMYVVAVEVLRGDEVSGTDVTVPLNKGQKGAYTGASGDGAETIEFCIPLTLHPGLSKWLICVDYGTSAISMWLGKSSPVPTGFSLELGDWLSDFDSQHEEKELDPTVPSCLMPSHVCFSPNMNMRVDVDMLSLGDLSLIGSRPTVVDKRLKHFDRTYDISIAFPGLETMRDEAGAIVFDLKRELLEARSAIELGENVSRRNRDDKKISNSRRLDPADVFMDCLDELGRYVAPRALHLQDLRLADEDRDQANSIKKEVEKVNRAYADGKDFSLILTHPSGIDKKIRDVYQKGGARLLSGFMGDDRKDVESRVTLIPEALAAARYGIQAFIDDGPNEITGERRFIALDIGAGTMDATVIDARIDKRNLRAWTVRSHFGLTIGGQDIDRAITMEIAALLEQAATIKELKTRFDFVESPPLLPVQIRSEKENVRRAIGLRFRRELRKAKVLLSSTLRDRATSRYNWADAPDVEMVLDIGVEGDGKTWPVSFKSQENIDGYVFEMSGAGAKFTVDRDPERGSVLRLRLSERFFAGAGAADERHLIKLQRFIGREVPAMTASQGGAWPHSGAESPIWIVTGRAALWPPIFAEIRRAIESGDGTKGRLMSEFPFDPSDMKRAVIGGAVHLAGDPLLISDPEVRMPLAVITFTGPRTRDSGGGRAFQRVASIKYLHCHPNSANDEVSFKLNGPFVIADVLPGLEDVEDRERRLNFLESVGIDAWRTVTPEFAHWGDSHESADVWTFRSRREPDGLYFDVSNGRTSRRVKIEKKGRVYGRA